MVKLFKAFVFYIRLTKAIKNADSRKAKTGKKQFVLNVCGKPMCVTKEHVRKLISEGYYKEGVSVSTIASTAIYKTK